MVGVWGGGLLRIGEKLVSLRRKRHQRVDQREWRGGKSLPDTCSSVGKDVIRNLLIS